MPRRRSADPALAALEYFESAEIAAARQLLTIAGETLKRREKLTGMAGGVATVHIAKAPKPRKLVETPVVVGE